MVNPANGTLLKEIVESEYLPNPISVPRLTVLQMNGSMILQVFSISRGEHLTLFLSLL